MGKRGTKPMTVDTQVARGTYRNNVHGKRVRARSLETIPYPPRRIGQGRAKSNGMIF
jgi:hypothetical protein